jgi:dipeptidyl-peptidase 4
VIIAKFRYLPAFLVLLSAWLSAQQTPVPSVAPQAGQPKPLTITDIFAEGGLTGRTPETVKWSPDGKRVSYVLRDDSGEHGQLWYLDLEASKPAVLVTSEKLASLAPPESVTGNQTKDDRDRDRRARYSIAGYHWAPDSKHLLFDAKGQLWLYRLENGTAVQITSSSDPIGDPKFSPDGKRVSYIRKHNICVRPVNGERETQLTFTNADDQDNILNGETDWVYTEELDVRSNYFWAPDGRHIVFLQMNELEVPEYPIVDFIPQHPAVDKQRYPKAGDKNPEVRIGVIDSNGGKPHWIKLSPELEKDKDYYIPRFGWVNKDVIYVQVLNRAQNRLDLYFVDTNGGHSQLMLSEKSDNWIEIDDNFRILKSGDRFLWPSWRDGHTHLYLYSFNGGNPVSAPAQMVRQLTHGDFEVFEVKGLNESTGTVYFTANKDDDRQRQLYAVKLDGGETSRVSKEDGTHEATFSEDAAHYADNYSALLAPPQLSLCELNGTCRTFWTSRDLASFNLIKPQFVDFKAEDGTVLHGEILMPPPAQNSSAGRIPVLLNPYGGPHGQTVRDHWGGTTFLFHQLLARDGIAILQVDNRGMGARGQKFAATLRHNFGEVELKDQLTAVDQALQQFPQLDRNRLGWWGWSYGGYMTLYSMTHSDRFKAGFAVAPVTDWKDYDTIYTERYMGLPKENANGYDKGSPINSAKQLHGTVTIAHGTSDDNVHMQNTIQMVNQLIGAGKQYTLLVYPRKTHSIAGSAARTHLFTRIREYFDRELLGMGGGSRESAVTASAAEASTSGETK